MNDLIKLEIEMPKEMYEEWCEMILPSTRTVACTHCVISNGKVIEDDTDEVN